MQMTLTVGACRAVVAVLVLTSLTGCKSWRPAGGPPAQVLADQRPNVVRITDVDGRLIIVRHPVVRNDSIVTSDLDPMGQPVRGEGVAYGDVGVVAVERFNPVKTALFAGALFAAGATWVKLNEGSTGGDPVPTPGPPKGFSLSLASLLGAFMGR